ncbi:elongation factor P maturation arginine rhamnosyltransferase EarP [Methylotenera sp.]|uniref:elongation factor P maturation arginine rhamnosyltransferase EarP n=1 Tax=Methylotenera sp. TaxID=2051956 RepID=UPI0027307A98|nr:elongation factor P maturation arginine rhamnosyltransferase EarP [Methylotenera sp.]MDP1521866.1 elongation factor P maturation arginine rhamnosyltransferase EarP [Methylotenera sp.]MDP2072094.1 elongation factor P maturation arginine rhamnosyltransferase EarP [Methylotenera sp.]MDP3006896.1 elongation factor P maturation arginine rhamnosyltransferase EarP [Methylotenera sp.]MDP3007167.1 elongation factor P maturation arginine rhamnosyltransferase EarP [Methylotenera sp.]MDP3308235.1 elong
MKSSQFNTPRQVKQYDMSNKAGRRWDVFCRIVDNFGDIGVCWRLSQQLAHEHHLQVRLFIDNLAIASKIIPSLNAELPSQTINSVEICTWPNADEDIKPADVALETFSCELPATYLEAMQASTLWVNLEYLSAEPWVADFHARGSNNTKITRHFFFPGFTDATGGLIRETNIFQKNQKLAKSPPLQCDFLQSLNLVHDDALKISLFSYPHAPIPSLLNAMAESNQRIHCYVPISSIFPKVAEYFGIDSSQLNTIQTGEKFSQKNLNVTILPFLSQSDYDKLLAICDINFVRGEDSWIRAIWAAKPFIWQPYLQTENTHITKLDAFLDLFYSSCDETAKYSVSEAHSAWVADNITIPVWQNYLNNLPTIKRFTLQQANQLAEQTDLAAKLVIFLQKLSVKV